MPTVALFDLDGTILDSWQAHADAAVAALSALNLPAGPDAVRHFLVSHDARSAGMDPAIFLRVWERWQPLYRECQGQVRTFPGAVQSLRKLRSSGFAVGLVTSKRRWAVAEELRQLGLLADFDTVVCLEDTERHKPNPEPLVLARERLGGGPAVYVGDAPTDIRAAQAAGMPSIGASWGWCGAEELTAAGADAVCREALELFGEIRRIGGRRTAS